MSLVGAGLRRATLPLRRLLLRRRVRRLVLEEADGMPLLVLPDVFNGVVFRTGLLLARAAAALPAPAGGRALDLGTGSGIGALFLARAGWQVTATDLNPEAVRCVRINALLNRLEERIAAREGDLFAPVAGERFSLVLFNPPFFGGTPRDLHDLAWRGADVLPRFLAALPSHLEEGGGALVVLSSHAPEQEPLVRGAAGLHAEVRAAHALENETVTVWSLRRA